MMFTSREIEDRDSVGFFLRGQRERLGLSCSQVAQKILVAEHYLEFIEAGQFDRLPGEVYFKHFLKRYVEFLGFTLQEVVDAYSDEINQIKYWKHKSLQPTLPLSVHNFITWPKIFRAGIFSIIALVLFAYLGYSAYNFLQPPDLTVLQPVDNIIIQEDVIVVEGFTSPEATVTVNNVPLVVEDGHFSHEFDLQSGINVLKIVSTKKHGRKNIVERQIIVDSTAQELSKN